MQVKEELNLKPCPFCGGEAFTTIRRGEQYKALFVECYYCGVLMPIREDKSFSYLRNKDNRDKTTLDILSSTFKREIEEKWNVREETDDAAYSFAGFWRA